VQKLLSRATLEDYQLIVQLLLSKVGFVDNLALRRALSTYRRDPTPEHQKVLTRRIEHELRYVASADLAYLGRWVWSGRGGISTDRIVADVARRLDVKIRPLGSLEAKLRRLVKAVAERQFLNLSANKQRKLLAQSQVSFDLREEVLRHIKRQGPVAILPFMLKALGKEAVDHLVMDLTARIIAIFIGKAAARQLTKTLATRFPWWAEWMGPVSWAAAGISVSLDLQAPAYRKTIPILLYLGLIALREGSDDEDEP